MRRFLFGPWRGILDGRLFLVAVVLLWLSTAMLARIAARAACAAAHDTHADSLARLVCP